MLESFHDSRLSALPQRPLPPLASAPLRHYQLVALLLETGGGQQRPVLGLRWYLPAYEHLLHAHAGGRRQAQVTRPFVLRAALGESIETQVTNLLPHTALALALVDDDYAILEPAGAVEIGLGETGVFIWRCRHAGIYPIYNRACPDPIERRSLLGVLMIEPQ